MERFEAKPFHPDGTLFRGKAVSEWWFGRTPAQILLDPALSSDAVRIFGILSLKVKDKSLSSFGMRELGVAINKSQQTVMRRLAELERFGLIKPVKGRSGQRHSYELTPVIFTRAQRSESKKRAPGAGRRRPLSVREQAKAFARLQEECSRELTA